MTLFLTVLSGLAWTVVYVEAIRIGLRDRSYAIPAAALTARSSENSPSSKSSTWPAIS